MYEMIVHILRDHQFLVRTVYSSEPIVHSLYKKEGKVFLLLPFYHKLVIYYHMLETIATASEK